MWSDQTEKEMALNDNDRDWIRLTIGAALKEHSKGKLNQFKSWSPLGGVVAIVLFVLLQWNTYTIFRTHTDDRLINIEKIEAQASASNEASKPDFANRLPLLLQGESNQIDKLPIFSIEKIKALVAKARETKVKSDPRPIQEITQRLAPLLNNSTLSGEVEATLNELLSYRSDLSDGIITTADKLYSIARAATDIFPQFFPLKPLSSESKIYGVAEISQNLELVDGKAVIMYIGAKPNPLIWQYRLVLVDGYEVNLDGLLLLNVVFRGSKIIYKGGRLDLQNTYFTNCTFQIDKNLAARMASSSPPFTFKKS